ncbi:hypothetical protein E2C01_004314 [Portunus trituberculatus]|uniref:Uncharacterized protein n=1 Tax=Portunus trituberculatus TaxID=210409 RepID=A0A5B7CW26_PORTR|nr:hypothetical protein [Portunus trituberculatus]
MIQVAVLVLDVWAATSPNSEGRAAYHCVPHCHNSRSVTHPPITITINITIITITTRCFAQRFHSSPFTVIPSPRSTTKIFPSPTSPLLPSITNHHSSPPLIFP